MTRFSLLAAPALIAIAGLGACSQSDDAATDDTVVAADGTAEADAPAATSSTSANADTLTLEGLGDLRLGQPLPANSSWAVRGAQVSDACQTASSPDYPGVYAMVTDGAVHRISVSEDSSVTLVEGIGAGSSLADVRGWFGGFTETPHKYWPAPAMDLTAPGVTETNPGVRFEIDPDGEVAQIHVGTMPELAYVEGCA